jgi:hypothetical protein
MWAHRTHRVPHACPLPLPTPRPWVSLPATASAPRPRTWKLEVVRVALLPRRPRDHHRARPLSQAAALAPLDAAALAAPGPAAGPGRVVGI